MGFREATQGKGGAEIISSALDAATQSLMGALAASVVGGQVADVLMGNAKGPQAVSLEAGSMGAARS